MYEEAKRTLTEANAVVVSIDQREFSDTIVVHRKWENIPLEKSKEFVDWLNHKERSIVNPDGVPAGTYKVLRNVYATQDEDREIHQYLAANLYTAAPYGEATTNWRIFQGVDHHSGTSKLILEMPDFDPAYVREASEALPVLPESFTNSIYTISDGLVEGTWYNRTATYFIDERGVGVLRWYLSKYNNDDLHFAYYDTSGKYVVEFFKFEATDSSLNSFQTDYWIDGLGNWYISTDGVNYTSKNGTTTASLPLSAEPGYGSTLGTVRDEIEGRDVDIQISRDPESGAYTLRAMLSFEYDVVALLTYLRNPFERVVDFILLGQSEDDLKANLPFYYFNSSGDWYYSADGTDYTIENGSAATGLLSAVNAFNLTTDDSNNEYRECGIDYEKNPRSNVWALRARMVYPTPRSAVVIDHPNGDKTYLGWWAAALPDFSSLDPTYIVSTIRVEQLPNGLFNYVFYATIEKGTGDLVAGANETTYGTPNVTVTDTVVNGAASLPASAGTPEYNANGTKITETLMLNPRFDPKRGTFSYTQRIIETWAPHANQSTGAVGYVEGPSELSIQTQSATLARGVSSGFAVLGSWSGGGRGIIRAVENFDGPFTQTVDYGQATKKFIPYNITIARSSKVRTSSRMYYYVKEPLESEYPAAYSDAVENLTAGDIGQDAPKVVSIVAADANTGSPLVDYYGNNYYDKLVTITYDDGVYTEVYYTADNYYNSSYWTAWRDLTSIRTYGADISTPHDNFMYHGHYQRTDSTFYPEKIRHRILKLAENLYALVIETVERTPWYWDQENNWILNAEGYGSDYEVPPSNPAPPPDSTTAEGTDTIPTIVF